MSGYGKKYKKAIEKIEAEKIYSIEKGIEKVKECAYVKFDESVDVSVVLGIKPDKADQLVRGSLILPVKFGKAVKVIAFAKGEQEEVARKAGADYVGAEDLIKKIVEENWTDFDYAVATPDLMGLVGKTAKILGPLGLLPNKKNNTVALDLGDIIKELKSGLLFFKNDSAGQVHFRFGKVSLSVENLRDNLAAFIKALSGCKPAASRGVFMRKIIISSTMGPGIQINGNSN